MPEYLSPGVYIEEVRTGAVPIEGVSTSTAGFVGQTERGPLGANLVTSWLEFQRWYGGYLDDTAGTRFSYLPFAVQGFFDNGGQRLFLVRVTGVGAAVSAVDLPTADGNQNLHVEAIGPGMWGNQVFVRVHKASQSTPERPSVGVTVAYFTQPVADPATVKDLINDPARGPQRLETYDNLGVNPLGGSYILNTFAGNSHLVRLTWTAPNGPFAEPNFTDPDPDNPGYVPLVGGNDGADPDQGAYAGGEILQNGRIERTGLTALAAVDEVSLLCVPDEVRADLNPAGALTTKILNQCTTLRDRFAILQYAESPGAPANLQVRDDTSYGAIYYPWIRIFDPRLRTTRLVPPGGHVAGICARTDIERGVHKAPANEVVRGIITVDIDPQTMPLQVNIDKGTHDILNPRGINVIRDFRANGRGIRVWGARTMSSDGQWKYVNVRRLFIFVEESIEEGTQWVVFEPNDASLWAQVRRSITNFLIRVWRSGALMGATQDEAFFVKCDRTTMTQDDIDNGRLICLIGLAPVKPAEFVIFRFSQKTAEAEQ